MEASIRKCTKIYRNCRCKYRNSTNKLIEEEEISILEGTDQLYLKDIKKKIIPREQRSVGRNLSNKKNWKWLEIIL